MRHIKLDVTMPNNDTAWQFLREFGEKLRIDDLELGKIIRKVDSYSDNPGGWHIAVTIHESEEEMFYDFLRNFCRFHNISFRDPTGKTA